MRGLRVGAGPGQARRAAGRRTRTAAGTMRRMRFAETPLASPASPTTPPMKQLTVIVQDRPGSVADVSRVLADRRINIEALSTEIDGEGAHLRLIVDRWEDAEQALRGAGLRVQVEDVLVVRLRDEPGALLRIAERFRGAGLSIRSLRSLRRSGDFQLVALVADDSRRARALLGDVMVSTDE